MAIETTADGSVIITGDDTRIVPLVALAHGIVLEMETGMKPTNRWSALVVARNHGVIPDDGSRPHKKKLLRLTVQKIRELKPNWEPSAHLSKALAK
jgi:hypothetical protein